MNRFANRLILIVCFGVSLLTLAAHAAESRPHAASGRAQFVSATDFVGSGTATHLGLYTESGSVSFSPTSDPSVLAVAGSIVYTAANGDELHADVAGELNTATGVVTAALNYSGGTGRFAQATGSSGLAGQLLPGGAISVRVSGTINY